MGFNLVTPVGTHTTTHLGPIAAQALNLLQTSPGSNLNPTHGGGLSTAMFSSEHITPFTKQSTLDSHLASTVTQSINFPLLPTLTPHT